MRWYYYNEDVDAFIERTSLLTRVIDREMHSDNNMSDDVSSCPSWRDSRYEFDTIVAIIKCIVGDVPNIVYEDCIHGDIYIEREGYYVTQSV